MGDEGVSCIADALSFASGTSAGSAAGGGGGGSGLGGGGSGGRLLILSVALNSIGAEGAVRVGEMLKANNR